MPEISPQPDLKRAISKENILDFYQIPERELGQVFNALDLRAKKLGFNVVLADLSMLTTVNDPKALEVKHDTCQSDGKTVYLHNDLEKVGGLVGRTYDLMHVGLGHGTQWSADENSGLTFFGDKSWEIATKAFVGASKEDLVLVHKYEEEAGRLALEHVRAVVDNIPELKNSNVVQMLSDYVKTDLNYIMEYYKTGDIKDFFANFKPNQTVLEPIGLPENLNPKARQNDCIPLIRLS